MKPVLLAAALLAAALAAPAAAQAQVAAGSVPNTFDRPAQSAPAPVPAPSAPAAPATPQSEDTLRAIIASAQAGAMDYSLMTDDLASRIREQEATVTPLIQGFGAVQAVDFVGSQGEADLFAVTFANAATQWMIGFDASGKVAALLFRPAP